jgi:anthranilate synthase component 1
LTEAALDISGPDELRRLNQAYPDKYPFLLQSTARDSELGRFDILFALPGERLVLTRTGELVGSHSDEQTRFLNSLDKWWAEERITATRNKLPFLGGWFLYLGYELAAEVEPSLHLHDDPLLPTAFAVRCPAAIVYDHETQTGTLVSEQSMAIDVTAVYTDIAQLSRPKQYESRSIDVKEDDPVRFTASVNKAKKYIEAGDVYQANLSRQWTVTVADSSSSESVYESLCSANPGPFAGIARWQGASIMSSSPERLVRVRDGTVSTRPIAGTRRRGDDMASDKDLSSELFAHPKERAEHIMLIDLERNDLGRVCEAGTVTVDEMMVLESYAHVHHIVSNIRGQLRSDVSPGQVIAAVFPGGTITGCPKVRCMEIIDELELAPRGAYTGSFGYLNRDGSLDLNILIRTMVKHDGEISFRAGGGIVADSEPQAELDETRAKAEGMLRALQDA